MSPLYPAIIVFGLFAEGFVNNKLIPTSIQEFAPFAMNTPVLPLDARGALERYMKLTGPLLQPNIDEE